MQGIDLKGRYEGMSKRWCIAEMKKYKLMFSAQSIAKTEKLQQLCNRARTFHKASTVATGTTKERSLGDETPPEEGEDIRGRGEALICSRRRGRERALLPSQRSKLPERKP